MALSIQRAVSDGTMDQLPLSIDYFDRADIAVYIGGEEAPLAGGLWAWVGTTDKKISFTPTIADGVEVMIKRSSKMDVARHIYSQGARFIHETLDENFLQVLRIVQEAKEGAQLSEVFNDVDMHGYQLFNLGPATLPDHAVPLAQYQADSTSAFTAKAGAEQARADTEAVRDQAIIDINALVDEAEGYRDGAASQATAASSQAGVATTQAGLADTARIAAESARTGAMASEAAAANSATAAAGSATASNTAKLGAEAAAASVDAKVTLAQDWATKPSGEVVTGQGYSAKKYAADAAASASAAAAAAGGGAVKISGTDTAMDYLNAKLAVSGALSKTILNPGANEVVQLSVTVPVVSVFGRTGAVNLTSADVTGALGFTPISSSGSISGSAGSVAWANVTGKPTNFVYADSGSYAISVTGSAGSVAWGNVSGKPSNFVYSDSATYAINISGNATTATQLSSTQQTNVITGAQSSMVMDMSGTTKGSFVCRATGTGDSNLAGMTFYNDAYGIKMGVRADGYFGIGGYSRANWSWYSDTSGNMVSAGNVSAYSDPRLKENVQPIQNALASLKLLNGVYFTWKHGIPHIECKAGKADLGILANQVEAVFPEIVSDGINIDGEQYKVVAYDKLVAVLIEAVKELSDKVERLERKPWHRLTSFIKGILK